MQSVPGQGLALGGIGAAIATYVAPQLGLTLPRLALIALFVAAVLMILGGFALEAVARRSGNDAKTTNIGIHAAHTGTGSVSGTIINHSTVHVSAAGDDQAKPTDQVRRAIAGVEAELSRALGQLDDANESGLYRRKFPSQGSRRHQTLSELLADHDLTGERQQLSQTYRQLERLNSRMRERKWSGGAMPEIKIPDVREDDCLSAVKSAVEQSLETLNRLRARLQCSVSSSNLG